MLCNADVSHDITSHTLRYLLSCTIMSRASLYLLFQWFIKDVARRFEILANPAREGPMFVGPKCHLPAMCRSLVDIPISGANPALLAFATSNVLV
jgi:hypothetical protein